FINLPKGSRFTSSTEARRRVRENPPDNPLLSSKISRIIKALGFYQKEIVGQVRTPSSEPVSMVFVNLTSPRHEVITDPMGINALLGDVRRTYGDGVSASLIDTQFGMSAQETIAELKRRRPRFIGLSAQLESNERLYALLDIIASDPWFKENKVLTVVGHNLPTNENTGILNRYPFVVTVRGEGELAVRELVRFVRGEISINDVPAASYVRGGKIIENEGTPVSVLELGAPARDNLLEILEKGGDVMIETSRGCGWEQCVFCSRDPFRAHKWESYPDEAVLEDMEYLQRMGARNGILSDWEFLGGGIITEMGIRRAHRLASEMKKRGITKLRIAFAFRADSVFNPHDSPELADLKIRTFKLLHEVGFVRAFIGVEFGSDTQLDRNKKGITARQNAEAVRILKGLGFQLSCGYIPLDPYCTLDEIRANTKFLRENNLYVETVYPLNQMKVQGRTVLYNRVLIDGLLGLRQANLHTFDVRYQNPDVQKIADALNQVAEVGSVFYVLKYMYRTKFLNQITGDEEETELLRQRFEQYNRMEIDYLEALVENVHDEKLFASTIQVFRQKRLGLAMVVERDIQQGHIRDENGTLKKEIEKIRPVLDAMAKAMTRQAALESFETFSVFLGVFLGYFWLSLVLPSLFFHPALAGTMAGILGNALFTGFHRGRIRAMGPQAPPHAYAKLFAAGLVFHLPFFVTFGFLFAPALNLTSSLSLFVLAVPSAWAWFSHRGYNRAVLGLSFRWLNKFAYWAGLPMAAFSGQRYPPYPHESMHDPIRQDVTERADERMATQSNEQVAQLLAGLAGPLQQQLLEKGFDFNGSKAILYRRLVAQVEQAKFDAERISNPQLLKFEFRNAFYLAGRAGLTFKDTRAILNPSMSELRVGGSSFGMWFEWGRGRLVQFVLHIRIRSAKPFYTIRSAAHMKANILRGFHLDALMDPILKGTEFETETRAHILRRVETSDPAKEETPDILIVRYPSSGDHVADASAKEQAKKELKDSLLEIAGDQFRGKMMAYLARVIIVTEPAEQLIKPSAVLRDAQKAGLSIVQGGNIRFDFYTAMPEQIDMNDNVIRFIVFSLLTGMRVLPISKQVESARVTSINA
ncbi:MAG: radical SAM protein, partial [Elusimicrobia bacterium]|nr:radical SAM protein [Candidatus Obscuribacterium magneticum]